MPIVLVIWVWICAKRIGIRRAVIFSLSVLGVISAQLPDIKRSLAMYFNARGENLLTVAKATALDASNETSLYEFLSTKLISNIQIILKYFLGLNKPNQFLKVPIADSFWAIDNVLYPKFLIPFLILGISWSLYHCISKKKFAYIIPVLFLGIATLPGLLSGLGNPEQSRLAVVVLPAYYLIAYAFYQIFNLCNEKLQKMTRILFFSITTLVMVFTLIYHVHNFFNYKRAAKPESHIAVQDYLKDYWANNANSVIVYHEYANLSVLSYVSFRWLGGEEIEQRIADGQVILVRYSNMEQINHMIQGKEINMLVTQQDESASTWFPDLDKYSREEEQHFVVYKSE